jgi:DNA-binding transcriptional LysR family regulator
MDRFASLEVFVAIVDTGSFARAAARLRMSPAMATTHLARLEERLGVRLLNRTTRRIDLTEQGRTFLEEARGILETLAAAESALRRGDRRPSGRVRIDAPASVGMRFIVPAMAALRAAYPDIVVDLSLGDRGTIFRTDGFDILLRVGDAPPSDRISIPLGQTRYLLVASPVYLAKRGRPSVPDDLLDHDCILYSSVEAPGGDRWRFSQDGVLQWLRVPAALTFNDGAAIAEAAIAAAGLAQTLDMLVADPLADGRLVSILDRWTAATSPVVLTCARDRYEATAVKAVMAFLADEIEWPCAVPAGD